MKYQVNTLFLETKSIFFFSCIVIIKTTLLRHFIFSKFNQTNIPLYHVIPFHLIKTKN